MTAGLHNVLSSRFAAALIAAAVLCAPSATAAETELRPWRHGAVPKFSLPATNGSAIALAVQTSRVVLVHFFATWCEPCREELPALARFAARAEARDVVVVPLSVGEPLVRVRKFLFTTKVDLPVLLDEDRAVSKAWKIQSLPTTVVLDNHLVPRMIVEADFDWDHMDPATLLAMTTKAAAGTQTRPAHETPAR